MTIKLSVITFDCVDNHSLATFWAAVFGTEERKTRGGDYAFGPIDSGQHLLFMNVPESKTAKNRLHLDLHTADHALEVARVVDLGATISQEVTEDGSVWTVLADPEGNEFCIVEDKDDA